MIFFFIIPMTTGAFGNYLLPLMIGARDMAFPRLNALSYWIFLASGIFLYTSLFVGIGAGRRLVQLRAARERDLQPRPSDRLLLPRADLQRHRVDADRGAVHRHDLQLRAPGMSLNRMPLFCFALPRRLARPLVRAAGADRRHDLPLPRPQRRHPLLRRRARGSALLWQHLFWFFGHPEVYILDRPRLRDRDRDHPGLHAAADASRSRSSRSPSCSSSSSASASGRTTCSRPGSRR